MRALTRKDDYAVRAVLDIARHHPERRTTRQITTAMDLPREFTSQILATLVRGDLLHSTSGPAGGYTLAREPHEITLLHIAEAADGPITTHECLLSGGSADWIEVCPLHQAWSEAGAAFTRHLDKTTIASLTQIDIAIRAGTYQPPDHTPPHPTTPPRRGTESGTDPADSAL